MDTVKILTLNITKTQASSADDDGGECSFRQKCAQSQHETRKVRLP